MLNEYKLEQLSGRAKKLISDEVLTPTYFYVFTTYAKLF